MLYSEPDDHALIRSELTRIGRWAKSKACRHLSTGDWDRCEDWAASLECVENGEFLLQLSTRIGAGVDLQDAVDQLETADDPRYQVEAATEMHRLVRELVSRVATIRTGAMQALVADGWTYEEIGDLVGITRARVEQIVNRRQRNNP